MKLQMTMTAIAINRVLFTLPSLPDGKDDSDCEFLPDSPLPGSLMAKLRNSLFKHSVLKSTPWSKASLDLDPPPRQEFILSAYPRYRQR